MKQAKALWANTAAKVIETRAAVFVCTLTFASLSSAQGSTPTAPSASPSANTSRNLVALVQPLWVDLTPAQQQVLQPFAAQWNTYPQNEKRSWVKLADRFKAMPPDQQSKLQMRMRDWAALTPDQRSRARSNFGIAKKAPQEKRVAEFEQYKELTPDQRRVLRAAGSTSNTAVAKAGTRGGLAPEAAQPLAPKVDTPETGRPTKPAGKN
jgi:hypothetical protein